MSLTIQMGSTTNNHLPNNTNTSSSRIIPSQSPSSSSPSPNTTNNIIGMGGGGDDERRRGRGKRRSMITRVEVLRERSRRAREQIRFLRDCHWALLEHLRLRLRHYYWIYGAPPTLHNSSSSPSNAAGAERSTKEEQVGGGGGVPPLTVRVCAFPGCKLKPMDLTSYCHQHILSDPNQTLYKPCSFVLKSGATGPVLCWKPVLRSMTPSLCPIHLQKAQRHISQALKKAGLSLPSSNRVAPKFHVLIAEYVHQIQSRRKEARKAASELAKSEGEKIS